MSLVLGMAWPVERTDFSKVPFVLEAVEGRELAGQTRF